MYRYEVSATVNTDITTLTGKTLFYEDDGKWFIDSPSHIKQVQYLDATDQFVSKTLDEICQELYTTDFAAQSTQSEISDVQHVLVDNAIALDKGTAEFDTLISHDWTDNTTWPATDDSCWMFEASASTKQLKMVKSEVQFSHDVLLGNKTPAGEFHFDIWVYNPLVDLGSPLDPDDETFVPGVSSGNPLRFLYKRTTFKSIRDVFNYGNEHFSMNANVDGISSGVTTVKFNYDQAIILRGDQGAQVRFCTKDNEPMGGDYCTVSVVVREEDIPS